MKHFDSLNNDVPIEAQLRAVLKENGELKSEIQYLESELKKLKSSMEMKDKAIRDFKDWQRRVAEYNYDYWLTKGIELAGKLPDKELVDAVRKSLQKRRQFAKVLDMLDLLERRYNSMVATAKNVTKAVDNNNINNC